MNQQTPSTGFEQRLLTQLRATVAERGVAEAKTAPARTTPSWRRAPRLALSGAVAAAAVVTALVVSAGGGSTQAAFAVEPQAHGGVAIEIYRLDDPQGLEQALEDAGIPSQINYLDAGMTCREPRFQASSLTVPPLSSDGVSVSLENSRLGGPNGPMTIGIGSEAERRDLFHRVATGQMPASAFPNLFLNPDWFGPGQTLVLTGAPVSATGTTPGGSAADVQIAQGSIAPCDPVPAPAGTTPQSETTLLGG